MRTGMRIRALAGEGRAAPHAGCVPYRPGARRGQGRPHARRGCAQGTKLPTHRALHCGMDSTDRRRDRPCSWVSNPAASYLVSVPNRHANACLTAQLAVRSPGLSTRSSKQTGWDHKGRRQLLVRAPLAPLRPVRPAGRPLGANSIFALCAGRRLLLYPLLRAAGPAILIL